MSGGCLDGVCGCLTVSWSHLGVSGRCLGEFTCHINHKQLNRNHHIKQAIAFSPSGLRLTKKCSIFRCLWGVWTVSGRCLEGVWVTLGDSGYCMGGYNGKSIDNSSLGVVWISSFAFSQWLPIGQKSRKIQNVILLGPRFFLAESMWSFRQNTLYLS